MTKVRRHNFFLLQTLFSFSNSIFVLQSSFWKSSTPSWAWGLSQHKHVTTFQNNLAVTKQQIVKKHFHQSWNINCPILFNTISFYTEMISISLFLGLHIELNILGTRDISCVLHEIQIWNTKQIQETRSANLWGSSPAEPLSTFFLQRYNPDSTFTGVLLFLLKSL